VSSSGERGAKWLVNAAGEPVCKTVGSADVGSILHPPQHPKPGEAQIEAALGVARQKG
jgi:hypothetical protein